MAADMTRPSPGSKPKRFFGGPRAIGALLPGVTRPAFRQQGAAVAQLMADWPAIVGPHLAASTIPRRFAAGTLTLGCAGPTALELQHLALQLVDRINGHLGRAVVQRFRFVQEARAIQAPPRSPALPARPPVPIPDFPDTPLRDALAALGARVARDPA